MYLTETDIMNLTIAENAPMGAGDILKHLITEDLGSDEKNDMAKGVAYYKNENDIIDRVIKYYLKTVEHVDNTKTNNKLSHNYHRIIIDQKVSYIVGNPIIFSSEDEKAQEALNAELGMKFDDIANQWVKGASEKGVEWLHIYFNSKGNLDYVIMPAEQIIPIYDSQYNAELIELVRYYPFEFVNPDGSVEVRYKAEWWDKEKVTFWVQDDESNFKLDPDKEVNPRKHWYRVENDARPDQREGKSWGRVPFIPLKNNDESLPDLNMYKALIDDYDLHTSDMSNNLADVQDVVWVLKGYQGTDLYEFMTNLKAFKAIKLSEEGGADTITADIPIEAREAHLKRLEEDIYTFAMALNIKTDRFGNSPSGIALKFLYSLLDMKANTLIRKMKNALMDFIWFIVTGINERDNTKYDPEKFTFTFNKTMIFNEAEKIDSAQKSKGVISDETIISNHPWVDNVEQELEKVKKDEINLDEI